MKDTLKRIWLRYSRKSGQLEVVAKVGRHYRKIISHPLTDINKPISIISDAEEFSSKPLDDLEFVDKKTLAKLLSQNSTASIDSLIATAAQRGLELNDREKIRLWADFQMWSSGRTFYDLNVTGDSPTINDWVNERVPSGRRGQVIQWVKKLKALDPMQDLTDPQLAIGALDDKLKNRLKKASEGTDLQDWESDPKLTKILEQHENLLDELDDDQLTLLLGGDYEMGSESHYFPTDLVEDVRDLMKDLGQHLGWDPESYETDDEDDGWDY